MSRAVLDRPGATRRRPRPVLTAIGVLLLLVSLLGAGAHWWTPSTALLLGVSAFAPYLMLAAPLSLAVLVSARRWIPAVVAAGLCAVWVTAELPLYTATTSPAGGRTVVVMTANLRLGKASAASVVAAVKRNHVDVLLVQELNIGERWALHNAGLGEVLPFHNYDARPGAQGTGMWSRWYLYDEQQRTDFSFAFVTARVAIPHFPCDPVVAGLHMQGPWPDSAGWSKDIGHLPTVLDELAAQPCAVLGGGDFNATPDVAQFRHLLRHGIADAAAQAGSGVTATYPSNTWLPPAIAIDHVLTRGAVATATHTVDIATTDHRALVASIALPRLSSTG